MKKFAFVLLLSLVVTLLLGCQNNVPPTHVVEVDSPNDATQIEQPDVDSTVDLPDDEKDSEFSTDTAPEIPKLVNKLTGIETTEELANIRPVAIMINNLKQALPQQGISQADVIYEILAEGGITRLLCLFTDYANLPETGSVRSSRDYYIDISDAHDAIYVHCGTSPLAKETLAERNTDNMDGIYFDIPFYRNKDRWNSMGMEHSMMTSGDGLVKGIEKKGYRTTSDAPCPLQFNSSPSPISNGLTANKMSLTFSYYHTVELEYDNENQNYLKNQYGKPHIDSNNNTQLAFENVIVLYCEHSAIKGDDAGRISVSFVGDGTGEYMSMGEYKKIKWHKDSRTSGYTLYEEDGTTELLLNPGKTYVAIAPTYVSAQFE